MGRERFKRKLGVAALQGFERAAAFGKQLASRPVELQVQPNHHPLGPPGQNIEHLVLGAGEVAAFHAHVVAAVAAEEVVHHQEHQLGVEHEQRRAAQRLEVQHVDVGRYRQVPHELAVLLDLHRPHRDVGAAAHEVQQPAAQVPGEALVDDLQRVHAAAHHAVGRPQVVGGQAVLRRGGQARLVDRAAGDAAQQRIDLVLRQDLFIGHGLGVPPRVTGPRRR